MTMKPKKIILPKREPSKYDSRSGVIRVDFDVLDQIDVIWYQTAMNKKEVISILLRDALSRVELVERKVYEMHLADAYSDEEEE